MRPRTSGTCFISPTMSSTLERRVSANRERTNASRVGPTLFLLVTMPQIISPAPWRPFRNQLSQPMSRTPRNA